MTFYRVDPATGIARRQSPEETILRDIHDLLAEQLPTKGDPCPETVTVTLPRDVAIRELCDAIRLTVEYVGTETLPPIEGWSWFDALSKYAPEMADALDAANTPPAPTSAPVADDGGERAPEGGQGAERAAGGRTARSLRSWMLQVPEDQDPEPRDVEPKPHVHFWGYTMDPIEVCECGTARRATDPEPDTVTVTLPRDVVARAIEAANYAEGASRQTGNVGYTDRMARVAEALIDALDAASATQEADQGEMVAQGGGEATGPGDAGVWAYRGDVEFALRAMRVARHDIEDPYAVARLRAALDAANGSQS